MHGLILADDSLVKGFVQMEKLLPLALDQPRHGDARPTLHDLGDLLVGDPVVENAAFAALLYLLFLLLELTLHLRQTAVLQLGGLLQIIVLLRSLDLTVQILQLLPELLHPANGIFLVFPLGLHGGEALPFLCQVLAQLGQAALGQGVLLLFQRGLLDLHLNDLPGHGVQLRGHGVHLGAHLGAGLVDQVDGLVREETVGNIPVGQGGGGNDGGVRNLHAVEHLIALLQTAKDGNGILHGGLVHQNGLEAALQSGVLFNILPVFVQRSGADAVQLAPGQHRLEEISGVHAAFGFACAHNRVQLVDKQDDLSLGLTDLAEDGLQPLLKLAPVFGSGDQRAHIQGENGLILQALGYVLADDPLGQPLGNGGFAHARLADQDGVVFRFAGEDADDVANLLVPADDRVHLLLPRPLDQIRAVLAQGIVGALRIVGGDPLVSPDGL